MLSKNEEDYLKVLYHLVNEEDGEEVSSKSLADYLEIFPASVSGMLKKLKGKELVTHEKYGKLSLSDKGHDIALTLIRKHRLWETFLHRHMNFSWDEVHDVAEQLEHIRSTKLIDELERFLDYPKQDPHGDPIPDAKGRIQSLETVALSTLEVGDKCRLISVSDGSVAFLKYVSQIGLALSSEIEVLDHREFDGSLLIRFNDKEESVSRTFAEFVFVEKI
ncbi:MAG: metal-dependent transcriptional regulator [Flavobacteriales bacterium]|nr:metal-dependent transcriptional regulator [Flavobacteriales bacterium]